MIEKVVDRDFGLKPNQNNENALNTLNTLKKTHTHTQYIYIYTYTYICNWSKMERNSFWTSSFGIQKKQKP